jgi:hypothetical protein
VKTVLLAGIVIRFGPLLLSLVSVPSSGAQLAAGIGYLTRVPEAIEAVREERRRTEAELEAFEAFATEIQELDAAEDPQQAVHDGDGVVFRNSPSRVGATTESVRALYRETVMDVDHYEEDYGEPLRTNVAAELGSDFGTALATTTTLTQPLQRVLIRASYATVRDRKGFEGLVESELESLTDAKTRLRSAAETVDQIPGRDLTDQSITELNAQTQRLRTVEQECESLIESRQADYVDAPEEEGLNFREYLYTQYEWTHPVVGDALDVIRNIRETKRRIQTSVVDQL